VRNRVYDKLNDEKISPEVRARAVRMVTEHEAEHSSRWAAVSSIAAKIGCSAHTLNEWVKKAEVNSGKRAGLPSDVAEKMKALERENRELRPAKPWVYEENGELRTDGLMSPTFMILMPISPNAALKLLRRKRSSAFHNRVTMIDKGNS
jgi:transposase-like protein